MRKLRPLLATVEEKLDYMLEHLSIPNYLIVRGENV